MGLIARKSDFVVCKQLCAYQPAHPRSLISTFVIGFLQGSHRLEKYLNLEGILEKSLKIKYALKSTGKSLQGLEKSLNSIFCRT